MKQDIENIIKKNLPEIKEHICRFNDGECVCDCFKECISQINTSLIADEVLKITKCNCCDEEDEHIFKDDRSTTRISRPCSGCGKHQTIAGALLKSKEWEKWYKYASENMLFDVDETLAVDAMSDEHWNSFMKFLNDEVLKVVVENLDLEKLAELEHEQWCDWSKNLFTTEKLSQERIKRWEQLWCPYDCLNEDEKDSDRKYASKVLQLLSNLSLNKENKNNEKV